MPKAISYTRFSTPNQAKGSTTQRQKKMIHEWLKDHPNYEYSELSEDDIGKSGFKGEHLSHGLGKILTAIENKRIRKGDYILVEAVDRIGRLPLLQMIEIFRSILSKGITIATLEDKQEYTETSVNESNSILILVGKIQQAHAYSQNLQRLLQDANEEKRNRARDGEKVKLIPPFWLKSDGSIIPERAEIVKDCINLYLQGRGTRRIILDLMDKHEALRKKHPTTLKRWFTSRALIGEWETKGESIPDVFQPLLDTKTFFLLQREIKKRRKVMSPEQTYDLSGIVTCSNCGHRYYFRRKKYNGRTIIYANCSTYLKRGKEFCNNNKTWPYEVLKYILDYKMPPQLTHLVWNKNIDKISFKLDELNYQLKKNEEQLKTVVDLLVEHPEQPHLSRKLKELDKVRLDIESDISDYTIQAMGSKIPELSDNLANEIGAQAEEELSKIQSDPIYYREKIKETDFRISGKGNLMQANFWISENLDVVLIRRSTQHKCYILKVSAPSIKLENNEIVDTKEVNFVAIDWQGVIEKANSENELIKKLLDIKNN